MEYYFDILYRTRLSIDFHHGLSQSGLSTTLPVVLNFFVALPVMGCFRSFLPFSATAALFRSQFRLLFCCVFDVPGAGACFATTWSDTCSVTCTCALSVLPVYLIMVIRVVRSFNFVVLSLLLPGTIVFGP